MRQDSPISLTRLAELKRRPDGTFRVIFLRSGPAEVGQYTVAQVLAYPPAIFLDHSGGR